MSEVVPCRWCGSPTTMLGTQECDEHWELRTRVEAEPDMARRMLEPDFKTPIKTLDEAKAWIECLHAADKSFHFEDSPHGIGRRDEGGRWVYLFSHEEAEDVRQRVAELYALDWSPAGEECPIGYALTVMGHTGHKE